MEKKIYHPILALLGNFFSNTRSNLIRHFRKKNRQGKMINEWQLLRSFVDMDVIIVSDSWLYEICIRILAGYSEFIEQWPKLSLSSIHHIDRVLIIHILINIWDGFDFMIIAERTYGRESFCETRTKRSVEVYKGKSLDRPSSITDRDRHCHGNVRHRARNTGETKVYCIISMKHEWIEGTCALSFFRADCNWDLSRLTTVNSR
jgi:hypothetical protein